tara:strand:+ start:606 stop:791 length:186 start_codon:yes stop_codon:yes gene_type:complete
LESSPLCTSRNSEGEEVEVEYEIFYEYKEITETKRKQKEDVFKDVLESQRALSKDRTDQLS